jgi:predicted esterase
VRHAKSLALIPAFLLLAATAGAQVLFKGQINERVVCRANPSQTYALYVPTCYDPARQWPIVYCFDPIARGRVAIERFKEGAEKYGFLIAGSNNSRNGPWKPTMEAAKAMVLDTGARLNIDPHRIYTAGFSGGARVASELAMSGLAAGVVACGGGFPDSKTPDSVRFAFFGTAGADDFNYDEVRQVGRDLEALGAAYHISVFTGGHQWAPPEVASEALAWFEIQAMRVGTRPKDEALIQATLQARLGALPALSPGEAYLEYAALARDYKDLAPTAEFERQAAERAKSREVRRWRKREQQDTDNQQRVSDSLLRLAEQDELPQMHATISSLRKKADAAGDSPARRLARRTLGDATIRASMAGNQMIDSQRYDLAKRFLELAAYARPERFQGFYDLARAQAYCGEGKKAIASLKRAIEAGFRGAAAAEAEPAFDTLRQDAAFRKVLAEIPR